MTDPALDGGAAFWAARGVRIEPEPDPTGGGVAETDGEAEARAAAPAPVDVPEARPREHVAAEVYATEEFTQVAADDVTDPIDDDVAAPVDSAPAQASLDDVEIQHGAVVDGLAVLSENLAEQRRTRAFAARPEPAWQLTDNAMAALPPLKTCIEAILMVVDEPVSDVVLAQVVERPRGEVAAALAELAEEYTAAGRGFELREVGIGDGGQTGWRVYSRADCAPVVERFVRDGQQAKLTQAALETLAVVAYRQPVSRSKVSSIRGVNCDGVMRTLVARGLVEECGTEHETGALLYRTSGYFLERMGLKSLDELPDLAPLLPTAAEVEEEV